MKMNQMNSTELWVIKQHNTKNNNNNNNKCKFYSACLFLYIIYNLGYKNIFFYVCKLGIIDNLYYYFLSLHYYKGGGSIFKNCNGHLLEKNIPQLNLFS